MMENHMSKNRDLLSNVDFAERVKIRIFQGAPSQGDPYPFRVEVNSIDETKHVVFDTSALKKMNEILTEKAAQFNPSDPKLRDYLKEFVGRMVTELYRNDLVVLEDLPDQPDDPYEKIRKNFTRR